MLEKEKRCALVTPEQVSDIYNRRGASGTTGKMRAAIRGQLSALRQKYMEWDGEKERAPAQQWLCDNFYVLERESRQSIKELAHWRSYPRQGELWTIFHLCRGVFGTGEYELCDQNLLTIIDTLNQKREVTVGQFDFFALAVKAALLGLSYRACLETEEKEQAARMMERSVVGLSTIFSVDFEAMVQSRSSVEAILAGDPAGVYPRMTEESRRQYRAVVARLALRRGKSERQLAEEAIQSSLAAEGRRQRHVGYHLLEDYRRTIGRQQRGGAALAMGAVLPLFAAGLLWYYTRSLLLLFPGYLLLFEALRPLVHRAALAGVGVDIIPRLELGEKDYPPTMVVISTLLPKPEKAPALKKRLEQLYFSNGGEELYFCVLADYKESAFPENPEDASQARAVVRVIQELNRSYGNRFMLFLRKRSYSKTQERYTGWERKRGAITQLTAFIRGEESGLHLFEGDRPSARSVKYIIALDADTNMTFESARRLISAAEHPMNRPVIDRERGIVTAGYGILAPRMGVELESARATAFARVMCGSGGVTAYDTGAQDIYQDLFNEGIFAGKGLLDVEAFHTLLGDRFPENCILSHDILEGAYLRTAFVSDIEMTDATPAAPTGWLARLHRWVRGDWQNLRFLGGSFKVEGERRPNPISPLARYMLADNLRRSLTPPLALLAIMLAPLLPRTPAMALLLCALLSVVTPPLLGAVQAVFSGGMFGLSRKYFVKTQPMFFESMGQALFALLMLPGQAVICGDAILRALWRSGVSRKNLLEWTTAAQSEGGPMGFGATLARYWFSELLGVLLAALAPYPALRVLGAFFAVTGVVFYYASRPMTAPGRSLTGQQRERLLSYCAAMWQYFEDYADAANHYLPPDNIQQSPVYRVANRTSPTNIGLMLLSALAARDCNFIDTHALCDRVERTLNTLERMKKFRGNLYNWYDTATLALLEPAFVSSVDSGNFICCLVTLRQGLLQLSREERRIPDLCARLDNLIKATDLAFFYSKRRGLFTLGYDVQSGKLSGSYYDFLMSEARLTSYYALASRQVGRKHWGALGRTMARCGSYAGPVSWTGTTFEYFMPHLLLPVYGGSLLDESLRFCIYCQRRRMRGTGLPWGISESAFYAFDHNLNYQYKAHGVQYLGVKRGLDRETVVSPYSSFLTIPYYPSVSLGNLAKLEQMGAYGHYGFYEAVDFTKERTGGQGQAVVRSYMAHHIGMSMVSAANALFDGVMQRRFMSDHYMGSADEFLQEKLNKDTVVFDHLAVGGERNIRPISQTTEEYKDITPLAPRAGLLSNGALTQLVTDAGVGFLSFGGTDLTRRSADPLTDPQGIFAILSTSKGVFSLTPAPFYDKGVQYSAKFSTGGVAHYAKACRLDCGLRSTLHPAIPCQQLELVVSNTTKRSLRADLLFYLEPTLTALQDFEAHPAFAKLFVTGSYDRPSRTLSFIRRSRDLSESTCLTVGFAGEHEFQYQLDRDRLLTAPGGLTGLRDFARLPFDGGAACPDAVCALRLRLALPANGQEKVVLLLSAAKSRSEGIDNIITLRRGGILEPKNAAPSPLINNTMQGRLGLSMLDKLVWGGRLTPRQARLLAQNTGGQSALWRFGISGDLPIVALEYTPGFDTQRLEGYIRLLQLLRPLGLGYDLAILCPRGQAEDHNTLEETLRRCGGWELRGARGGVHLIDPDDHPQWPVDTLLAAAVHHTDGQQEQPRPAYEPAKILPVTPAALPAQGLRITGGVFLGDAFYVERGGPLPWCHILANSQFGTLVSDSALGCSWAYNSRENRLTPWQNDAARDNLSERILIKTQGQLFDPVMGGRAVFSSAAARYEGWAEGLATLVEVSVSAAGCAKYCTLTVTNHTDEEQTLECAYYLEPVLGVVPRTSRFVKRRFDGETVLFENPYNTAVSCAMALTALRSDSLCQQNREEFFMGNWRHNLTDETPDRGTALIIPMRLPPRRSEKVRFILAAGATPEAAHRMARLEPLPPAKALREGDRILIETPDSYLNHFINHFAPHQVVQGRIWGRCGFFQGGGAFGFRDQLQDACGVAALRPDLLRLQILRCCRVQFLEGDVLHWWHNLPASHGGTCGVRTKYSDDLLWLPYAVARYHTLTGDGSILEPQIEYITAPPLTEQQREIYITPEDSGVKEDVYGHCLRAIERACRWGDKGLPLMGGGDWNDGFNEAAAQGRGQSVWLAMFLIMVLEGFAPLCQSRGDHELAQDYLDRAAGLRAAVDQHCWDGRWYLRAFYDNGEPMGSKDSDECNIDLLPQSFAVLCGMPDRHRVETGLQSALEQLVDEDSAIIKLFSPPFANTRQNPGYVRAYPPGIRENGGQYTHSAVWFVMALLEQGRVEEGYELLRMLNPAYRCSNEELALRYKLEPYYMAADIYDGKVAGRGGWSIYTGAAAWYYRVVTESLCGIHRRGGELHFSPRLPEGWQGYNLQISLDGTSVAVRVQRAEPEGATALPVVVPLDGGSHTVKIEC